MKLGTPTTCPVCKRIHPFGARLGAPYDRLRYCSDKCDELARTADGQTPWEGQAADCAIQRRPQPVLTVFCNCCVSRYELSLADGGDCPTCGYRLSLYGPFEPKPSFALPVAPPPPMPLTITRPQHA